MREKLCDVCGAKGSPESMCHVIIDHRSLLLCLPHADTVASAMPRTLDELRELFVGSIINIDKMIQLEQESERRSPLDRRGAFDRRVFPPRPEGRRLGTGRRATDPSD